MQQRTSSGTGLVLALLAAASFGTSGAFGGSLLAAGWTPGAAVTVRVVVAALALTVVVWPSLRRLRGRGALVRRGSRGVVVYGLVAVAGCQLAYFNAVEHLSVAVALLLEYSGALMVVGWLWLRHGQRPRRLTVAGATAAVLGLALVLDLTGDAALDVVGVLWGLGAAVGLAVYFVISAGDPDEESLPPLVVAWGGLVVGGVGLLLAGLVGALPLAAPRTDVVLLDRQVSWLVPVLCLALVAAAFAYVAGIAGARALGAKVASFVGLTEVLFAVAFAWVLLGEALSLPQLVGGLLVIAGIALVRVDEARGAPAVSLEPHQELLAPAGARAGQPVG